MVKKQEEVIDQDQQQIEEPKPIEIEKPKLEKQLKPTTVSQATKLNFNFSNDTLANEEDMSPVRDILSSGEQGSDQFIEEVFYLSVDDVARFLKGTYDAQGWFTYPELWVREPQFFLDIAEGILPNINSLAQRIPAVGHAIKTVSAAGSWGRLIWDLAGTWILIYKRKQLEAEKKKEEEGNNSNEPSNRNGIYVP